MLTFLIFFLGLLSLTSSHDVKVIPVRDPKNITIALGSCLNTFNGPEAMDAALRAAINTDPDLWMWIGDAVYLDGKTFLLGTLPGPGYDIEDDSFTLNIFKELKEHPTYVELKNKVPIIGTWDDHDYAYDNTDKNFKFKERNMKIFLDFLDEPADSPRRKQNGVYYSYYVGEEKLIKIILFDIRYNSDPESAASNLFDTDTTKAFDDMLGDEQWAWLDNELKDDTALYTLLISGTQFIPDDRPIISNWFINSREKLFDMLVANKKSGIILISGDVHYAEMLKHPCPDRIGYNALYEFTTSGMTHSAKEADIVDGVIPEKYSTGKDRFFEKNIAVVRLINQEGSKHPNLRFEALDLEGNVGLSREVPYSDVTFNQTLADNYTPCENAGTKIKDVTRSVTTEVLEAVREAWNKVTDL